MFIKDETIVAALSCIVGSLGCVSASPAVLLCVASWGFFSEQILLEYLNLCLLMLIKGLYSARRRRILISRGAFCPVVMTVRRSGYCFATSEGFS